MKSKRRRSRQQSNGLRRDSRSGARAVSPAAFLQYQNNFNLADMSMYMGSNDNSAAALQKNSPSNAAKATELSPLKLTGKFSAIKESQSNGKPFLQTEYRVGEHKATTYKRNEEEYKKEIEDSLKQARGKSPRNLAAQEETKESPRIPHRKPSSNAKLSPIRK